MGAPRKVVVLGTSCAGKSTFSARLAAALQTKHIELDALFWEPGWIEATPEKFRARVSQALTGDSWVVDGNYTSKVQDLVWSAADTLIWLDPPLARILRRLVWRSFARALSGERLWGHSRESLRHSLFSRKSLLVWILNTHGKKQEDYARLLRDPPAGRTVLRFRSVRETEAYLKSLGTHPSRDG